MDLNDAKGALQQLEQKSSSSSSSSGKSLEVSYTTLDDVYYPLITRKGKVAPSAVAAVVCKAVFRFESSLQCRTATAVSMLYGSTSCTTAAKLDKVRWRGDAAESAVPVYIANGLAVVGDDGRLFCSHYYFNMHDCRSTLYMCCVRLSQTQKSRVSLSALYCVGDHDLLIKQRMCRQC
eukprot:17474-Heterococcus_DN1.PRE.2